MSFRNQIPKRRLIVTEVNHYREHRSDLKLDFMGRCGYCNDLHIWRFASYEIDHFIPRIKDKKPFLTIKTETDYSNLVYACKSCNNSKSNKWPTGDEKVPNYADKGFIDPCDDEYHKQFTRLANGQIRHVTPLGEWIYNALKLHKPQHEFIWNIEQLDLLIEESEALLHACNDNKDNIKDALFTLYRNYRIYTKKLGDN